VSAPPASERPAPDRIRLVQGQPTRVWIGGGRHRFGIAQAHADTGLVRITVLHDGSKQGFDLEPGSEIEIAGQRWSARIVEVVPDGRSRVLLERVVGDGVESP